MRTWTWAPLCLLLSSLITRSIPQPLLRAKERRTSLPHHASHFSNPFCCRLAMASRLLSLALSLLLVSLLLANVAESQFVDSSLQLMGDSLEWQTANSVFDFGDEMEEDDAEEGMSRRSLYWWRHNYISYGALAANRVPCPPRSGRSYYTHNCYRARGPVHPYRRGCSKITRCRASAY